jgi:hypothetical protein
MTVRAEGFTMNQSEYKTSNGLLVCFENSTYLVPSMACYRSLKTADERVEALRQAHNTHDVDRIMKFFVEDGLDYSDYGIKILNRATI